MKITYPAHRRVKRICPVLLCDSNGNVLYYGNIAQNNVSGTATLNIPAVATAGYTLESVFPSSATEIT